VNNTLTVEKLFEGRLFRIPDYQRGYAWGRKQWDDFWEDVDLLESGHHYTGTVVLDLVYKPAAGASPEPSIWDQHGKSYQLFDVVDGQQRLTTIVLVLDAIRREMTNFADLTSKALGLRQGYIETTSESGERLLKLSLNADTHGFWAHSILADHRGPAAAANASQDRLAAAQQYFSEQLARQRTIRGSGYRDWLDALRMKITNQLVFVPYEVSTSAEVGVIFEVMNDRGKDLTELEKAKNYLLYLAEKLKPNTLEGAVNGTWSAIFQRLMAAGVSSSGSEDQLLRAHWLMAYNPDRRSWSGTASVKAKLGLREYVGRREDLIRDTRRYVELLGDASVAYSELSSPWLPNAFGSLAAEEKQRQALVAASRRVLRVGTTATFIPLLIAARLRHPDDPTFYAELLNLCERYAFRVYRLLRKYANSGQSQFFRLANDVFLGTRDKDATLNRIRELAAYYSPEDQFLEALERTPRYGWVGLKYMLYEWEHHLAGKKAVQLDWERLEQRDASKSIEHILPQTPTDPYWLERFTADEREQLTHDLGNLVLTEDNSVYLNKPFGKKRGVAGERSSDGSLTRSYANSTLFQEKALLEVAEWTPAAIQVRRDEILAWARRRWHIDPPQATEGIAPEDDAADEADQFAEPATPPSDASALVAAAADA
jgi:hypothetical protein